MHLNRLTNNINLLFLNHYKIQQYQNSPFSFDDFREQWEDKYSWVNLVTTEENSELSNHTKTNGFTDPKTLYQNCLVVLENLLVFN